MLENGYKLLFTNIVLFSFVSSNGIYLPCVKTVVQERYMVQSKCECALERKAYKL